jgi:trimethylamine:corrinoid methyltransferase-like protein
LNDETVNLDEIGMVGHGGNYFTSEQTLASMDELGTTDSLWSNLSLDAWNEQNMPSAENALIDCTNDLYTKAKTESANNIDVIKKGEDFRHKQYS